LQGLGIGVKGLVSTTDQSQEGAAKPRTKKATQKRAASESSASKTPKESNVSVTTSSTSGSSANQKGWLDLVGDLLPDVASTAAQSFGIDPRVAGRR
jgi:hypothetical protein